MPFFLRCCPDELRKNVLVKKEIKTDRNIPRMYVYFHCVPEEASRER